MPDIAAACFLGLIMSGYVLYEIGSAARSRKTIDDSFDKLERAIEKKNETYADLETLFYNQKSEISALQAVIDELKETLQQCEIERSKALDKCQEYKRQMQGYRDDLVAIGVIINERYKLETGRNLLNGNRS